MEHLHIKLSDELKRKLKIKAAIEGTNMSEIVIKLIEKELEEKDNERN